MSKIPAAPAPTLAPIAETFPLPAKVISWSAVISGQHIEIKGTSEAGEPVTLDGVFQIHNDVRAGRTLAYVLVGDGGHFQQVILS